MKNPWSWISPNSWKKWPNKIQQKLQKLRSKWDIQGPKTWGINEALDKVINFKLSEVHKINKNFSENLIDTAMYKKEMSTADTFMTNTFRRLYKETFWVSTDIKLSLSRFAQNPKSQKIAVYRTWIDSQYETFEKLDDVVYRMRALYG